jgi:hypothetical protein
MMMNTTTARAVRYIYRESREKTERESPLLHREMIRHMIDRLCSAGVGQIKVVQNPSKIKRTAAPKKKRAFVVRQKRACSLSDFFATKFQTLLRSLSLARNTTRAIHIK